VFRRGGRWNNCQQWILVVEATLAPLWAQTPGQPQPEFIRQGQQLMRAGKLDDALALYRQTLQTSPDSVPANLAAGSVLDLMGRGEDARRYFQKGIQVADTPERKAMAQRAMAISYAFEGNCKKTVEYEQQVLDYYGSVKNFYQEGEIADEAARVCLDSADLDAAYHWYQVGHDTGLKEPGIKAAREDLWEFRWEHAQARLAARHGNQAEAQKHVAAAKAILDKGTNPEQAQFFPYLQGYVAFYVGDYKVALEELLKANPNDPFIVCMIAQTYEKLGDGDNALDTTAKPRRQSRIIPPPRMRFRSPRRGSRRCEVRVSDLGSGRTSICVSTNQIMKFSPLKTGVFTPHPRWATNTGKMDAARKNWLSLGSETAPRSLQTS
jgi:tetratricopeptide (TPR) repeat protein